MVTGKPGHMAIFSLATLSPAGFILLSAFLGGSWGWLAVIYMTVVIFTLDRFMAHEAQNADPEAEFPASGNLLITLGFCHFLLSIGTLWAVAGPSGLAPPDRALTALATALYFGQISHPVAHELIHKPGRGARLLGRLIYTSLLFGHHASAHLRVHHPHVGSDDDPASARRGEGFYRYFARAWRGGFRSGLRAETRLRRGSPRGLRTHPYTLYCGGATAFGLIALATLGLPGLATLVFLGFYAQIQILLSDYVQHYGLRRARRPNGALEPVGPQHSWNAPQVYSSAMMLNAPRHSDHHMHPGRVYPALQLDAAHMPVLPHSLPVMAVLALAPPLWFRVMDPLCDHWQARAQAAQVRVIPPSRATPA